MVFSIFNDFLEIFVKSHGAELSSILKYDIEYLWQGDETYWTGQSPILFPIVGKLKSGIMPQHGFGRRSDFSLIEHRDSFISFNLKYNEDTLKVYPYKSSLTLSYELVENTIKVSYNVENLDNKDIYFSIGAHPAFNVPLFETESLEDYYIELESKETAPIFPVTKDGFISKDTKSFFNNNNLIPLTSKLFINDALIFNNLNSNEMAIKNTKNSRSIKLNFNGFPWFGIWSKPNNAPFVCLEPWFGHADFDDFNGDFSEKDGLIKLNVGEKFNTSYTITVI
ncbi:aldose 1-epimerase family protein [Clostridium frigidicarnis]|uniref:Galactose mutarotase n=1 Tax=Clostridium frigidicarnis TaxID=84698 RepID=A0A1I0VYT4_9CLOT|nr:aldose 1-epimerase family protein [Clostridium frigidicarnis]SFA81589.1 Galactose mutarotase [Clostridium frigidicarnis]